MKNRAVVVRSFVRSSPSSVRHPSTDSLVAFKSRVNTDMLKVLEYLNYDNDVVLQLGCASKAQQLHG